MNIIKSVIISAVAASSLFAINSVSNLTANAPHNSTSPTNDSSIVFTFTPPSDDAKYYYELDINSSNSYALDANRTNWNTKTLTAQELSASTITLSLPTVSTNGAYYLHIVAVDVNDSTSGTVTSSVMNIDINPGTVTVSPDGGALSSVQSLTMTQSEGGNIYYSVDGSTPTSSSTKYTAPLSIVTAKTVKAILIDTAGNIGFVVEKVFTSTVQPTVTTTQNSTTAEGTTFATTTNAGATVVNTSLTIDSGSSTGGFTRYKYKLSTDNSYETVANIATPIDISALTSGSYTYHLLGGDAYNYISEASKKSVTFTVDNDAPTSLSISYDGNTTKTKINPDLTSQNGLITLSATGSSEIKYDSSQKSAYTGYANTYSSSYTLDASSVADGSTGVVRVYMAAKDASGNWAETSKSFTVDKQDPIIAMPSTKTYSTAFDATVSFDDDGNTSTIDSGTIKYLVESTSNTCSTKTVGNLVNIYTAPVSIPAGSSQCLYAIAIDEVGNESNNSTVSSTLFTYNATQSTLVANTPTENQSFATVSTYNATPLTQMVITGLNYDHFGYSFDGGTTETNSTSRDENIDLTSLSDGDHNITIHAYKSDNSVGDTLVRNFTIDNIPPTAFTSNDYNDSNFTVETFTLTLDNSDGDDVYYSEDNTTFAKAGVTDTNSSQVNIILTKTTTLYTYKEDRVGNQSSRYSATLTQNIPIQTYSLTVGWNMVTLPTGTIGDVGLSSPTVWDYNGTTWGNNITGDQYTDITATSSSRGYWIAIDSSSSVAIKGTDTSSTNISASSTGWNFLGTTSAIDAVNLSDSNLTWVYDAGIWKFNTNDSDLNTTLNQLGYTQIISIPAYSGFWVYKY